MIEAPGEESFLDRHLYSRLLGHPQLEIFRRYFDSGEDREDVAHREGLAAGEVVRLFSETAPVNDPVSYGFRDVAYQVRSMAAVCDDYHGDRFGKFGAPVTLRMYLTPDAGLPAEMFILADWNYLDGGFPFYVGYAYGSILGGRIFLSGLQSDLAQRYHRLFQARRGSVGVRVGLEVVTRSTEDLRERFGAFVPKLRSCFQRRWIEALLSGVVAYARSRGIEGICLHQFELRQKEQASGHFMHRIYRGLPRAIPGTPATVVTECNRYRYHVMSLTDVSEFLQGRESTRRPHEG